DYNSNNNDGYKTASCTVTVSRTPTSVTLNKYSSSLKVGGYDYLYATVYPYNATNQTVTWTTSNSSVATVSSWGTVNAVGSGTATITATTSDGYITATCRVTVSKNSSTSVTLNKYSSSLKVGGYDYLYATVYP
ncbi:Ig-like domain-containing protein, partial [Clostridium arbusti]|uniref:Ig-like domain-containing protein n=1 Tax=Clostridium arbusti TaxID=1137848 RepID=UPI000289859C